MRSDKRRDEIISVSLSLILIILMVSIFYYKYNNQDYLITKITKVNYGDELIYKKSTKPRRGNRVYWYEDKNGDLVLDEGEGHKEIKEDNLSKSTYTTIVMHKPKKSIFGNSDNIITIREDKLTDIGYKKLKK